MTYKGYTAQIIYSNEDQCLVGHVANISDVVGFHGDSVSELRFAFEEAVDDYLETCKKINKVPQQPYSGELILQVTPEIHVAVATAAEKSGKSISQWISEVLSEVAHRKI